MKKGFSLVELLVTISLIAIIATGALALIDPVKQIQKGNDARRKADLAKLQAGFELYRADKATYPASLPGCGGDLTDAGTTYVKAVPCDPKTGSSYEYTRVGGTYTLVACLENATDPQADAADTCGGANVSYTVYNP